MQLWAVRAVHSMRQAAVASSSMRICCLWGCRWCGAYFRQPDSAKLPVRAALCPLRLPPRAAAYAALCLCCHRFINNTAGTYGAAITAVAAQSNLSLAISNCSFLVQCLPPVVPTQLLCGCLPAYTSACALASCTPAPLHLCQSTTVLHCGITLARIIVVLPLALPMPGARCLAYSCLPAYIRSQKTQCLCVHLFHVLHSSLLCSWLQAAHLPLQTSVLPMLPRGVTCRGVERCMHW
jgi:hypothetical protein